MKRLFLHATTLPELRSTGAHGVSSTVLRKDSKKRKHVFDEFISKTRYISPVIKERFDQMGRIYRQYSDNKLTPLDGYLENEKISYSHLIDFVRSMGRQAKKPFQESLQAVSKKVLGTESRIL